MAFIPVCHAAEVAEGEARLVEAEPEPIAIFNVAGEFFAIGDTCTHGEWSLAEGYLEGDMVECTLHAAKFCVRTGEACTLPATEPVKIYPTRVVDGILHVDPAAGTYSQALV